jgi:hypothetical protein
MLQYICWLSVIFSRSRSVVWRIICINYMCGVALRRVKCLSYQTPRW